MSVCFDCPKIVLERTEDRLGEKFRAADRFNPKTHDVHGSRSPGGSVAAHGQEKDTEFLPFLELWLFVALDSRKGTHQGSNTVAFNYICSLEIIREEE